jgi:hypothetical protein
MRIQNSAWASKYGLKIVNAKFCSFQSSDTIPLSLKLYKALAEAGDPRAAWIIGLTYYMQYVSDRKEGKGFCLYF